VKIVALIRMEAFGAVLEWIEILKRRPVDPVSKRFRSTEECPDLTALVMAPRREAGSGDPEPGFRSMRFQNLGVGGDGFAPSFP
jgi:hypothetical protein